MLGSTDGSMLGSTEGSLVGLLVGPHAAKRSIGKINKTCFFIINKLRN
jgi:hypothetical protein